MVGADLSRDRPPRGSQRSFESGQSLHPLSGPLQPGVRFLRDPLPATDAPDFTTGLVAPHSATRLRAYPVPRDEHGSGGPHLSAGDRLVSVSPPSRETSDHTPFGSSLSVDLARSCLTAFTSGSLALVLRPSLAPHPDFDFQNHATALTGIAYPSRVATLSVRSARGRYRPRTAPRLLAAEHQVAYTLPRGQQLIARFAPRTQPASALWAEAATETAAFFYAFRHDVLADVSPGLLFHT
jgi:hypothetical protein